MTTATATPTPPEFSRPLWLRELRQMDTHTIDLRADAAEHARIASLLDLVFLGKLRLHGKMSPVDQEGWRFEGYLGATVTQACVITLQPVKTRLDLEVQRTWLPPNPTSGHLAEIELSAEDLDEVEPLTDPIDLGLLAVEELALALPAYPRAEGVEGSVIEAIPPGAEPIAPRQRPFAALAGLRNKLQAKDE
ncbi:MAG: DUF177 domain-containing protein [Pseudomonadota bacterium]